MEVGVSPFCSLLPAAFISICKKKAHILAFHRIGLGGCQENFVIPDVLGLYFPSGPTGQAQVRWSLLCSEGASEEVHHKEQRGTRLRNGYFPSCFLLPSLGWLPKMVSSPRGPRGVAQKVQLTHRTLTLLEESRPRHLPRRMRRSLPSKSL